MDFVVRGYVKQMLPIREGVSQRTGQPWQSQSVIFEHESGQYPKCLVFDTSNANIQSFGLIEGECVVCHLNINAREYNGRWFNSIECWKVERDAAAGAGQQQGYQMPPQQPAPQPQRPVYNPAQQQQTQQPAPQAPQGQQQGQGSNDLPF